MPQRRAAVSRDAAERPTLCADHLTRSPGASSGAESRAPLVAVVVPAYNEAALIRRTLGGIPHWVTTIVVVDDASTDSTRREIEDHADPRVVVVPSPTNRGVGAAIVTGYGRGLELGCDVLAVMAGDDQMDPEDLRRVIEPILEGSADYVKGNRFLHPRVTDMPRARRFAGKVLAVVTSIVAGIRVDDSQCGYTAIRPEAARLLLSAEVWSRYGYPNDVLTILGRAGLRIVERPVRPVYADEQSGVRFWHVGTICWVLMRRTLRLLQEFARDGQRRHIPTPVAFGKSTKGPSTHPVGPG